MIADHDDGRAGGPEDDDGVAEAWALGLLEEAEAREAARRAAADPVFAARAESIRARFLALDETAERLEPSQTLWPRIAASLDAGAAESAAAGEGQGTEAVVPPLPPTSRPRPAARPAARPGPRRGLARAAVGVAAGIAAGLALVVGADRLLPPEAPAVVALLIDAAGDPIVMVEDFGDDRVRITPLGALAEPGSGVYQLWTKPSEEIGPVSLGMLQRLRRATFDGPDLPAPTAGQLYEITLEPEGGSPTGLPTGAVLVKGLATRPD